MKQSIRESLKERVEYKKKLHDRCRDYYNRDYSLEEYKGFLQNELMGYETLLKTERPKAKKIVAEYLKELSPVKKRNEFEKGVAFGMNYLKTRLKLKGE